MDAHLGFNGFLGERLHLGVSGSVAAYKALELVRLWTRAGASVSATLTQAAQRFVTPLAFRSVGASPVYSGMFERPDPFDHLDPSHEAKAFVVAPATAQTLARLAQGMADDLLACQALAFRGPLVLAPAMNPAMWAHPATQANWALLKERGCVCIEPDEGEAACGDVGRGRLARTERIFLHGLRALARQDLGGRKVLVTLGPTHEHLDPVRFVGNPSSGAMGASLAVAAWLRGADVHAVCGPVDLYLPEEIRRYDVVSARSMHEAAMDLWPSMDMGLMVAAVADFAPASADESKLKKGDAGGVLQLSLHPTPDILAGAGRTKAPRQRLLGFAAETGNLRDEALRKLHAKGADLIAANLVGQGTAFRAPVNRVLVADRAGREEEWPLLPKPEVAWRLLDWLADI